MAGDRQGGGGRRSAGDRRGGGSGVRGGKGPPAGGRGKGPPGLRHGRGGERPGERDRRRREGTAAGPLRGENRRDRQGERPQPAAGGRPPKERREGGRRPAAAPPRPDPVREATAARLAGWDVLDVEIEKLVAGGDGMARPQGIPIFVPRAAPGDRLRVRLVERQPDYGRAEIVEVLAPGPGRRRPPCPYYERCGGCQLQHLDDELQSRLKAEATLETLARLAGIEPPAPPEVLTAGHWSYRLRTQLHTRRREPGPGAASPGGGHAGIEVGYFARGTNDLVPVEACPILVPELERLLPGLPAQLAEKTPRRLDLAAGGAAGTGATRVADIAPARHLPPPPAADSGPAEVTVAPVVPGLPQGEVELTLPLADWGETFTYAYDARCFFQAHRDLVVDLAARAVGPWQGGTACDLYAGVGLFTLPLARRYARVLAVEGDAIAARYARRNARRNRAPAVEVVLQAVETWIPHLPESLDRLLVDPPRGGLSRRVRDTLRQRPPARLTYVSCHAATLARDLRHLLDLYRLESLVLLDMFPQSGHMEAVAQLVRGG